jgi:uncharacterized membrane protein YsdA (DUF1294 family)
MQFNGSLYWFPILYIIIINIVAFLAMWWDKRKAVKHQWRVAEITLQVLGFAGGAVGILGGMYKLRHKTQKRTFQAGAFAGLIFSLILYWLIGIQYL